MKKIFKLVLFVSVFALFGANVLADTTPIPTPPNMPPNFNRANRPIPTPTQYTAEQQTCINNARKAQQDAIKSAQDTFNEATKDAQKTRQDAIKAAQDILNSATKDAQKKQQDAIQAAQKIKDPKARTEAMRTAFDSYNNNSTVKQAKEVYTAAVKVASDNYNNDSTVIAAKPPYTAAMQSVRDTIKQCTGTSNKVSKTKKSAIQSIGDLFRNATSSLLNALGKSTSSLFNAFKFGK